MSYSVTRLTLYAILSSIEFDLRDLVKTNLDVSLDPRKILGEDLYAKAYKRALSDLIDVSDLSFDICINYLDFADTFRLLNSRSSDVSNNIINIIKKLTPYLDRLLPIRNRVMHSRPLDYEDFPTTLDTSKTLINEYPDLWNNLAETLDRLSTEPSFVLDLEIPRYLTEGSSDNHNLPIPDFDETGFIGREDLVKALINRIFGPYPVVSIIGEGGVGKTALALKVAYSILDYPNCPFDAIVWSTSKTMLLTPTEIVKIEGAILDSMGLLSNITEQLAGERFKDRIEELHQYLEKFRILLILDNLETVLDDRIRWFLEQLPEGSKILITSRIGLGAYEFPIKLKPLEEAEAISLLRALAKMRGVSKLTQTDNKVLSKYCQKMQNNPGFIKWFVSAVQTGLRPEEVLDKRDLFLEFCMSNVYEYLSPTSKQVVGSMLCVPGKRSQAELAFLNELEVVALQRALQQLLTTNMIIMNSIPTGSSYTSHYDLADLARDYLQKHHSPTPQFYQQITRQRKRLVALEEKARSDQRTKPYSPYSILVRSQSDFVVARYLQSALYRLSERRFSDAEKEVLQARSLAPEYFEVHRVDAWVKVSQRNITAARTAYEAAIELEPNHAPLLFWYGNFLMRYLDDVTGALSCFSKAYKIDSSFEVAFELARANLFTKNYAEVEWLLNEILQQLTISHVMKKKAYDLYLQIYMRQADDCAIAGDISKAVDFLFKMRDQFNNTPIQFIDTHLRDRLRKTLRLLGDMQKVCSDENLLEGIFNIEDWILNIINNRTPSESSFGQRETGRIERLPEGQQYGFIRIDESGEQIFFHKNTMYDSTEWLTINIGDKVIFSIGDNDKGLCAIGVRLLE